MIKLSQSLSNFEDFKNLSKNCTAKSYSSLVIGARPTSDNHSKKPLERKIIN